MVYQKVTEKSLKSQLQESVRDKLHMQWPFLLWDVSFLSLVGSSRCSFIETKTCFVEVRWQHYEPKFIANIIGLGGKHIHPNSRVRKGGRKTEREI